jgi:hypothetical protein
VGEGSSQYGRGIATGHQGRSHDLCFSTKIPKKLTYPPCLDQWGEDNLEIVNWSDDPLLRDFEENVYGQGFKPSGDGFWEGGHELREEEGEESKLRLDAHIRW